MWATLIGLSALVGALYGWIAPERRTLAWGAVIPWFGVLAWVLYNEYFGPYRGGGASMWPIAQLIAGTVAAAVGMLAAGIARAARVKMQSSAPR